MVTCPNCQMEFEPEQKEEPVEQAKEDVAAEVEAAASEAKEKAEQPERCPMCNAETEKTDDGSVQCVACHCKL